MIVLNRAFHFVAHLKDPVVVSEVLIEYFGVVEASLLNMATLLIQTQPLSTLGCHAFYVLDPENLLRELLVL